MISRRIHHARRRRSAVPFRVTRLVYVGIAVMCGCGGRTGVRNSESRDATIAAPVQYDAHRFFLRPITQTNDTLLLFIDTGGSNMLRRTVAERAGLSPSPQLSHRGDTTWVVPLPLFKEGAGVPIPAGAAAPLMEVPSSASMSAMAKFWPGTTRWSGELGGVSLGDGMWTFDYGRGRLLLHPRSAALLAGAPHVIPIFFKVDGNTRPSNFARLRALVDGDSLDLLFDTGATVTLADSAWQIIGDGLPRERATSFIAASVFDRWRRDHPEWRVIERAEFYTGREMIELPTVSIGGFSVGPVWFTRRLDTEFVPFVSTGTDRPVIGAVGGSALQYFAVTVDYRRALAEFTRAR